MTAQCKSLGQISWRTECWAQFPSSLRSKSEEETSHFPLNTRGKPSECKSRTLFYRTFQATVSSFANISPCNWRKMFPFLTLAGNVTLCWAVPCNAQHCSVPGSSSCPTQPSSELIQPGHTKPCTSEPSAPPGSLVPMHHFQSRIQYDLTSI